MEQLSEIERAYVAGFFDADGYVGVVHPQTGANAGAFWLRATITNNHTGILQEFQEKLGGRIYAKDNKREQWLHQYNLAWQGAQVKDFLSVILPYLKVKRQQAEIALQFPLRSTGEYKTNEMIDVQWKIYEMLKQLKHDKKPIPVELMKGIAYQEHSEMLKKREQTVSLRSAHPDWSIRQIAREMNVSSTMIHKYLKSAGVSTSMQGWGTKTKGAPPAAEPEVDTVIS